MCLYLLDFACFTIITAQSWMRPKALVVSRSVPLDQDYNDEEQGRVLLLGE
ncbi:hypothetical protein IF1G_06418 [Cordyceps javanica]|uniref:Uncharacterized protein n=1 Tax=Cordyceps javanica TaxID=43265 RepID=A0A545V130_9HYPO|nr:hypothetical protein IF1G_06418 [Cordyceps javanica]